MSERCSAEVLRGGKYQSSDKKWYCGTHLPENEKKRAETRQKGWETDWALSRKKQEADAKVSQAKDRLLFAIRNESEEEVLVRAGLWEKAIAEREVL